MRGYTIGYGYKTFERAQDALEQMFANGEVSRGEFPEIYSYGNSEIRRYAIRCFL